MICCGDPEGGLPKEEERPDEYISVSTENDWLLKITFIVICQSRFCGSLSLQGTGLF